ncbi:uncharacterized protein TNCV_2245971 [Trichonephila clavipes]|uniref:Uncharacterized protein n=1 Tax=Trichonephila clavipes TaxID=2585209 RepID=A0A8X6RC42_TRICX|nr:uncharacterized protein TNCV_2245971 [Trichonephila clavipes]
MPTFTITSTSIIRTSSKCISFSFHIVVYHSGKNLFRSASSIKPTTQIESRLLEPISASAAAPDNSLNTSTSSLSNETCPAPTTSNKFAALSTEVHSSVPLPESASNSEPSNICEMTQGVKQNSKKRRKRAKVQKPGIEIKMAKHKPRQAAPTEYTTDDEDLIMYDVQEEELETDPTDKFAITEYHRNNPDKYIRALTPTRFRKSRS